VKRVLFSLLIAGNLFAQNNSAAKPAPAKPAAQTGAQPAAQPKEPDFWAGRKDLFVAPKISPNVKVELGPIQRFTLPNGLEVLVVARPQVPVVDLVLAIKAGGNDEPKDRVGLSQFVASMLRKGTQKRTADQISELADFVGASFNADAGDDYSTITCHARSKDLGVCLDLTSDVVEHPTFPAGEMKEVHDQLEAAVESVKDNPQALAGQHAQNLYYGEDDPRGRATSKRTLAAIDRKALLDFHKAWYAPNHALLAVAGDVDPKAIKATLQKAFAGWKKHAVPKQAELKLPGEGPMKVRLVDKPDATQSAMVVMGPGVAHRAPDYYAVRIMAWALGAGGFSSRLMKVVRSEGGKTYGARLGFGVSHWATPWTASTFTRVSETAPTLKLVLDTIAEMKKGGPTVDEIDAAKGNLVGGYGLKLETAADLAHVLLTTQLDGMDAKAVEEFPQRMTAVSKELATQAAAAHLTPTALTVVGPAAQVRPLLEKAGWKVDEVIPFDAPINASERAKEAAEVKKSGDVSPAEAEAGKKLVAEALAAKGADLGKVQGIAMTGKGTMTMRGQTVDITIEEFQVPGKSARQDISMGPMKMQQIFSDGKAWMKQGDKVMELPSEVATQMKKGLLRDPNFILLYAQEGKLKARALPPVTDGGVKYDAVELIGPDGDKTEVLLDSKTHLIARFDYKEEGKSARQSFGDYRKEGGIAVPHKIQQSGEGTTMEVVYDKVTINPSLPATTFKP
jgi:zinc protease